jgi:NAD-dependent deacetylase
MADSAKRAAEAFPSQLVNKLRSAQHVVVLTGAGVSAESGVPTFRDAQTGLWSRYEPQQLATPQAFQQDPKLVWEWYTWRRQLIAEAKPNPAHLALVELEQRVPRFTLITQNVDGLHRLAGSQNVIELHGNIMRTKRFGDGKIIEELPETDDVPPRCPDTGDLLRPDVVWFGEMLPEQALSDALAATTSCDLFFSVGTSGQVEPAASLPYRALQYGATVAIVNIEAPARSSDPVHMLKGPAGEIMPALLRAVWPRPLPAPSESQTE